MKTISTWPLVSGLDTGYISVFDRLLNLQAVVQRKTMTAAGAYGVQNQTLVDLDTVPCRVSTKAAGRPHENKSGTKYSTKYQTVYMRPYAGTGAPLTPHDWLQVTDEQGTVHTYDIFEIKDPSGLGHHFEITVEEVTP